MKAPVTGEEGRDMVVLDRCALPMLLFPFPTPTFFDFCDS